MEVDQNENTDASNVNTKTPPGTRQSPTSFEKSGAEDVQRSYKNLIRKIIKKDLDGVSATQYTAQEGETLVEILKEAESLFTKSTSAQDLLLDARVFKHVSRICRQHAEELSMNQKRFHYSEFAEKLVGKMGQGFSENPTSGDQRLSVRKWSELGSSVTSAFNLAPGFQYLYGSFPAEKRETKQREKREKREKPSKGARTQASVVDFSKLSEDQSSVMNSSSMTDKFVTSTFKQLVSEFQHNGKEPLCYFSFVLDPDSFGRSVENIFYVSFLVKEGKAGISMDAESGLPNIWPIKSGGHQAAGRGKSQALVSITMDDWHKLKTGLRLNKAKLSN